MFGSANLKRVSIGLVMLIGCFVNVASAAWPAHFSVDQYNHIWGHGWEPDAVVTVSVGEPAVEIATTQADGEGDWWLNEHDHAHNFQPGDLVTVQGGTQTATHTIRWLVVTEVDADNDLVRGEAEPNTWVDVGIYPDDGDGVMRWVQANSEGDWEADFSVPVGDGHGHDRVYNLQPGTHGAASQFCDGTDVFPNEPFGSTAANWHVPDPNFTVGARSSRVTGREWPADVDVTVTIGDLDNPTRLLTVVTDQHGSWWVDPYDHDVRIEPGDLVTAAHGDLQISHVVRPLTIEAVDIDAGTVSGEAPAGEWIHVMVHPGGDGHQSMERRVQAGAAGEWSADFSADDGLAIGDHVYAHIRDPEEGPLWAQTRIGWQIAEFDPTEGEAVMEWLHIGTWDAVLFEFWWEDVDGVLEARLQTPDGVWHQLRTDRYLARDWYLYEDFESVDALLNAFPSGTYQLWVRHMNGTSTFDIDATGTMPSRVPVITKPAYGQSDVDPDNAWLRWENGDDHGGDAIWVGVNAMDDDDDDNGDDEVFSAELPSGAVEIEMENLDPNRLYESIVAFLNVRDENVDGLEVEVLRATIALCPFSTNTDATRFNVIERVELRRGAGVHNGMEIPHFAAEIHFGDDLQPVGEAPLFDEIWLLTPTFEGRQLFDRDAQESMGGTLSFEEMITGYDHYTDGIYLLAFRIGDETVCTPIPFLDSDGEALANLQQTPVVTEPLADSVVASPFDVAWNPVQEAAVNTIVFSADNAEEPALLDDTTLTAQTGIDLEPDAYTGFLAFAQAFMDETNADGIEYGVAVWRGVDFNYSVGYQITVEADPEAGGTVEGGGVFLLGDSVTVTATPADGYGFVRWVDAVGEMSTQPEYTFDVADHLHLTAIFQEAIYTLSYVAGDGGAIDGDAVQQVAHGGDGTEVTAIPEPGDSFWQWDDLSGDNPRQDIYVTGDLTVTAHFAGLAPTGNVELPNRRPELSWRPIPDATWYQIELRRNGVGYHSEWLQAETSWTPTWNLPDGNYEFRVQSWMPGGVGSGPWSVWSAFTVIPQRPTAAPSDLQPADDAQIDDNRRPVLEWEAVDLATWFRVQLSRDGRMVYDRWVEVPGVSWQPPQDLAPGTYDWRVVAWGPDGYGPWSDWRSFTIVAQIPGFLGMISPDGEQCDHTLTYRWQHDAHATWYQLWVGYDRGGAWHNKWYRASEDDEQTITLSGHPEGAFLWWIRGWSPDGFGPWTGPISFTTPSRAPARPDDLQAEWDYQAPTTLRWNDPDPSRSDWFRIYVQRGPDKVIDQWIRADGLDHAWEWTTPGPLAEGGYAWWIGAWNAATGRTVWSARSAFIVASGK